MARSKTSWFPASTAARDATSHDARRGNAFAKATEREVQKRFVARGSRGPPVARAATIS
ncbi:MAG: hypothetical protein U0166_24825 [Acidobacteriota bacterium]